MSDHINEVIDKVIMDTMHITTAVRRETSEGPVFDSAFLALLCDKMTFIDDPVRFFAHWNPRTRFYCELHMLKGPNP